MLENCQVWLRSYGKKYHTSKSTKANYLTSWANLYKSPNFPLLDIGHLVILDVGMEVYVYFIGGVGFSAMEKEQLPLHRPRPRRTRTRAGKGSARNLPRFGRARSFPTFGAFLK